jgi:hypothetical protein
VFIRANGDDVNIAAKDEVTIASDSYEGGTNHEWTFRPDGRLKFPDGTIQTTGNIRPAAYFLTWEEGTTHLPDLNTHFGWNSNGLWFQNSQGSSPITSYPIFTDFTIPEDSSVVVEFIFDANTECNNIGVCVYSDGDNPEWDYATNSSRIAAQFDCFDLKLFGRTTSAAGDVGLPESGLYRVRFAYDPTASTNKVTVSYKLQGSDEVIESLSINEALPAGPYRIGFAADQDSSSTKTYMTYMSINVNDGDDNYGAELDTGNSVSGTTGDITFDGVKIIGGGTASGDGYGYSTIELVPDAGLIAAGEWSQDQYLIIDPTAPNHIHIRAGGIQDASTADLFLGAENTHVKVSDSVRSVDIEAKKDEDSWTYPNIDPAGGVVYVVDSDTAEPDYNDFMIVDGTKYVITSVTRDLGNSYYETTPSFTFAYNENYTFTRDSGSHRWRFGDEGDATLILPSENPTIANNAAPGDITLSAYNGIKLAFADVPGAGLEFPDNTVQTTAYAGGATGTFETPDSKLVTVTDGIITSIEPLT